MKSCDRFATTNRYQDAFAIGLRQLVEDKSIASCQQTCWKLIVKTCYPQACCKLFQQVVTSLQLILTDLLQPDEIDKFVATCRQTATSPDKIDNLQQVCGVFGCVAFLYTTKKNATDLVQVVYFTGLMQICYQIAPSLLILYLQQTCYHQAGTSDANAS